METSEIMTIYRRFIHPLLPNEGAGGSTFSRTCPRCNSPVFRISRRFVDLLISTFVPVRRYRCNSMTCNWEGNLRNKQSTQPDRSFGVPSEAGSGTSGESLKSGDMVSEKQPR
jgi:hypothetical protein